jgi:hypothetical protein
MACDHCQACDMGQGTDPCGSMLLRCNAYCPCSTCSRHVTGGYPHIHCPWPPSPIPPPLAPPHPPPLLRPQAHSFELDLDTTGWDPYQRGGIVTQVKQPATLAFKPLAAALESPGEFLLSDFSKMERSPLLHLAFQALDQYQVGCLGVVVCVLVVCCWAAACCRLAARKQLMGRLGGEQRSLTGAGLQRQCFPCCCPGVPCQTTPPGTLPNIPCLVSYPCRSPMAACRARAMWRMATSCWSWCGP